MTNPLKCLLVKPTNFTHSVRRKIYAQNSKNAHLVLVVGAKYSIDIKRWADVGIKNVHIVEADKTQINFANRVLNKAYKAYGKDKLPDVQIINEPLDEYLSRVSDEDDLVYDAIFSTFVSPEYIRDALDIIPDVLDLILKPGGRMVIVTENYNRPVETQVKVNQKNIEFLKESFADSQSVCNEKKYKHFADIDDADELDQYLNSNIYTIEKSEDENSLTITELDNEPYTVYPLVLEELSDNVKETTSLTFHKKSIQDFDKEGFSVLPNYLKPLSRIYDVISIQVRKYNRDPKKHKQIKLPELKQNKKFHTEFSERFKEYQIPKEYSEMTMEELCSQNSNFELKSQQKLVRDIIYGDSDIRSLMLIWKVGSGKTCAAISAAESFINLRPNKNKITFITKKGLDAVFESELENEGDGCIRAVHEYFKTLNTTIDEDGTNPYTEGYTSKYEIYTHSGFYKKINDELNEPHLVDRYMRDRMIIIDEVQNIVSTDRKAKTYNAYLNFVNSCQPLDEINSRIMLMTGTPVSNDSFEFVLTFNLLKPKIPFPSMTKKAYYDRFTKLVPLQQVIETYYKQERIEYDPSTINIDPELETRIFKPDKINEFKQYIRGYISYFSGGNLNAYPEDFHKIVHCAMSEHQQKEYIMSMIDVSTRDSALFANADEFVQKYEEQILNATPVGKELFTKGPNHKRWVASIKTLKEEQLEDITEIGNENQLADLYNAAVVVLNEFKEDSNEHAQAENLKDITAKLLTDFKKKGQDILSLQTAKNTFWFPTIRSSLISKTVGDEFPDSENGGFENFEKYSAIYSEFFRYLDSHQKGLDFAYNRFVNEKYGLMLLSTYLEYKGWTNITKQLEKAALNEDPGSVEKFLDRFEPDKEYKTFAIYYGDSKTETRKMIVDLFNSPRNQEVAKKGRLLRLILGSASISEGVSLMSNSTIHILTGDWNINREIQLIARGIRLCSFTRVDLTNEEEAQIYLDELNGRYGIKIRKYMIMLTGEQPVDLSTHLHLINFTDNVNIYRYMYFISMIKQFLIDEVLSYIQEVSVDCHLNKYANMYRDADGVIQIKPVKCDDENIFLYTILPSYQKSFQQFLTGTQKKELFSELNSEYEAIGESFKKLRDILKKLKKSTIFTAEDHVHFDIIAGIFDRSRMTQSSDLGKLYHAQELNIKEHLQHIYDIMNTRENILPSAAADIGSLENLAYVIYKDYLQVSKVDILKQKEADKIVSTIDINNIQQDAKSLEMLQNMLDDAVFKKIMKRENLIDTSDVVSSKSKITDTKTICKDHSQCASGCCVIVDGSGNKKCRKSDVYCTLPTEYIKGDNHTIVKNILNDGTIVAKLSIANVKQFAKNIGIDVTDYDESTKHQLVQQIQNKLFKRKKIRK
uniref:Helicase ATP-binding domain-containing protein n=1 Tax=viral metagenome TaxID=1070528 RepID=A0A6C0CM28_9ZZZZ